MTAFLRPLTEWPAPVPGQLLGILTDIDDTLTTDGAITPDALQALGALKASGLHVIPITGRPVGWSEPFAAPQRLRQTVSWATVCWCLRAVSRMTKGTSRGGHSSSNSAASSRCSA